MTPSFASVFTWCSPCVHVSVQISPSYKDISLTWLGTHLPPVWPYLSLTNHICNDPISKCHILRLGHGLLGDTTQHQTRGKEQGWPERASDKVRLTATAGEWGESRAGKISDRMQVFMLMARPEHMEGPGWGEVPIVLGCHGSSRGRMAVLWSHCGSDMLLKESCVTHCPKSDSKGSTVHLICERECEGPQSAELSKSLRHKEIPHYDQVGFVLWMQGFMNARKSIDKLPIRSSYYWCITN